MPKYKFAEILLPVPLHKIFTYSIPKEFDSKIIRGGRVTVNFGKRKLYTGIVISTHNNIPDFDAKDIEDYYDEKKFVTEHQLQLWQWISTYYCCSQGDVLNAAIPSALIPSSQSGFYYDDINNFSGELNEAENKILTFMQNAKISELDKIADATNIKNPMRQLQSLQQKGIISINQQMHKKYKPTYKNYIVFKNEFLEKNASEYENLNKKGSRQKDIINYLSNERLSLSQDKIEFEESEILKKLSVSKTSIVGLEKKGLISIEKREVSRIEQFDTEKAQSPQLSEAQQKAYDSTKEGMSENKTVLLHGITSSGKTEIYIKLIEEVVAKGKQALYMLPEIALTTQMILRLRKHFGDKIGVFHSKYSLNSRSEIYQKLLKKEYNVILGVRSSVFLPFIDLGIIIVDEEHESSYKQQNPDPRYNARDIAIVLSNIHKCPVILGSATPSIESYNNAKTGKYKLVELNTRFGDVALPEISIIDIKDGYRRKIMKGHFHPDLLNSIETTLEKKEQVILFQNRRGYAPYLECKDCGWVPHCNSCNVSLTYHKFGNSLTCHYCGEKSGMVYTCKSCGSTNLTTKGLGTEQIEDEITNLFPEARVARLDFDTAKTNKSYEKIFKDFANYNTDILVGTQMITKGLDFERLSLVGILNADNMLNFPDFRAFERAYQLFAQVSGRAGRRKKQGKVLIQTFTPSHPILAQVLDNDYISMFNDQINERSAFRYPPDWSFIIIKLKNKDKQKVHAAANILANELRSRLHQRVKGPEEPLINRIKNYYILNIHLRFEKKISSAKIKEFVIDQIARVKDNKELSSTSFEIDVDPI
ncbi:MAG: primosomal protein N' [Bacteroidales bacterium]|nr:primosomal protein N' [Bacteroidales bacterium]